VCDLLDPGAVARLPDARNVVFMAGMKFGATGNAALTWAMNTTVPAIVARRFCRSRIAAFSTGNIYGLSPIAGGGSRETDPPQPVGEYAMSCLGRERIFEHGSRSDQTPVAIIRLNYACELRYGVLVDLAQRVWRGEPVDLTMGRFNVLWQGDANAWSLLTLAHAASPPFVINITGPETLTVRAVVEDFARRMGRAPLFRGEESDTALLSDARRAGELFGAPRIGTEQMIEWIAEWTMRDRPTFAKPTHFENREGAF
jgi:nucleoside-diphosphate-sugar epimerase